MSLIFRSVKKISKKNRKTNSKYNKNRKCCKDPFEDNPMKFVVEDEENRSDFPTLNSVYKTELFGTPLPFRNANGYDCMKYLKIKTKLQSIVFMNEYMNKSFEELRWDDYQCNRKGSRIFEERNYLKCLSKDVEPVKWRTHLTSTKKFDAETLHIHSSTKFPALIKPQSIEASFDKTERTVLQTPKIILQRPNKDSTENKNSVGKSSKERSILTNVNKFCPVKEAESSKVPEAENTSAFFRSSSDINLSSRKEEMVKDNLQRYFSSGYSNTSVPYEFYTQNNNYFLPCTNINLAYKNKQTHSKKNQTGYIWDVLKTNPFGYHSIFDKLDPVVEKGSLYEKLFGSTHTPKVENKVSVPVVEKYTSDNKFSKNYFWSRFSPYPRDKRQSTFKFLENASSEKSVKSKKYWLGLDVAS